MLLDKVNLSSEDKVVLLGDLLDRGPFPAECIQFARENGFSSVLGNHEDKHLRWRKHEETFLATGKKNPMQLSPERIQQNQQLSEDDTMWMRTMTTMFLLPNNWVAVHGGLEPAHPVGKQRRDRVIRCRYVKEDGKMKGFKEGSLDQPAETFYWADRWMGPRSVVFGHAVHKEITWYRPTKYVKCIALDTGCVYGGKLSAAIFEGEEVSHVSVDAKKTYYNERNPLTEGRAL